MNSKISLDLACLSAASDRTNDAHGSERSIAYHLFLVPVDFSEHSKKTIQYARQLAALMGASLRLVHVFQIPDYPAAFYHGRYLEHEAVKIHAETAKREATAQLSLIAEEVRAN
jgi:nucleotide-binding universal stress UspA family protein